MTEPMINLLSLGKENLSMVGKLSCRTSYD